MTQSCRRHQKSMLRWRFVVVLASVLVLHAVGAWWWMASQSGAGLGAWSNTRSAYFRVRATVLQEVLGPNERNHELQGLGAPLHQAEQTDKPLVQSNLVAETAAKLVSGEEHRWSPIPSDYLFDEQVDVSPRPKDDWALDWVQVPRTQEAWRVTIRMWVSASGLVDHVEMLDAQPAEPWIARLMAPLAQTEMEPATLAGQPVPVTYVVQLAPDQLQ